MITIDGRPCGFEPGWTVLQAARQAGVSIPTLCTHEGLPPYGACRLCLVKIEGMRGFPPACSTPAEPGMVVTTRDQELLALRRSILELILVEHPNACLLCRDREACERLRREPEKGGRITGCQNCPHRPRCELRAVMEEVGLRRLELPSIHREIPVERDDPFFARDLNLCILCGRCVRLCQEVLGLGAIAFVGRGQATRVGTAFGHGYLDGPCTFCGSCLDVCPTGALSAHGTRWYGQETSSTRTTCTLCGAGCALELRERWDSTVASVLVAGREPGGGHGCALGRFCVAPLFNHRDRLQYPLVRTGGVLAPTDWDAALAAVVHGLGSFPPEQVGLVASRQLTGEAAWLLGLLARRAWPGSRLANDSPFATAVHEALASHATVRDARATVASLAGSRAVLLVGARLGVLHGALVPALQRARRSGATIASLGRWAAAETLLVDTHFAVGSYASLLRAWADDASGLPAEQRAVLDALEPGRTTLVLGEDVLGPDQAAALQAALDLLARTGNPGGLLALVAGNARGVHEVLGRLGALPPDTRAALTTSGRAELPAAVEFLVVQDAFASPLIERADVVLPAAGLPEDEGTVTSFDSREQRVRPAVPPPGFALPDHRILALLAAKLGLDEAAVDPEAIRARLPAQSVRQERPACSWPARPGEIPIEGLSYRGAWLPDLLPDLAKLLRKRGILR